MLLQSTRLFARLLVLMMLSGWLPQAPFVAPLPAAPVAPAGGALGDPLASPPPLTASPVIVRICLAFRCMLSLRPTQWRWVIR